MMDEIAWFKRQYTLCSTIYLSHVLIATIKDFENSPYDRAAVDLGVFNA
jgi:hypothetical protein